MATSFLLYLECIEPYPSSSDNEYEFVFKRPRLNPEITEIKETPPSSQENNYTQFELDSPEPIDLETDLHLKTTPVIDLQEVIDLTKDEEEEIDEEATQAIDY